MRSVKLHPRDNPWITPVIKDTIKKRQLAWAKSDSEQYKFYRNKVMKLCKMARRRFYHDINLRKWWDGIKLLYGLSNPLPLTSITVNGTVLKDIDLAEAIIESNYRYS